MKQKVAVGLVFALLLGVAGCMNRPDASLPAAATPSAASLP